MTTNELDTTTTYDEAMIAALKATGYTVEQSVVLQRTTAKGLTAAEMVLFLTFCARSGLDPFRKQVYAMKVAEYEGFGKNRTKVGDRLVFVTGIDGLRCTAERSGKYRGQTPVMWAGKDGVWKDFWLPAGDGDAVPSMAKVGIYRDGAPEPIYAVAHMREFGKFYRNDGGTIVWTGLWRVMPAHLLAKCAEALALRKALPAELSNLYTKEEVDADIRDQERVAVEDTKPAPPALPPGGTSRADQLLAKMKGVKEAAKAPVPRDQSPEGMGNEVEGF